MDLPPTDLTFLADRGIAHQLTAEGQVTCVVVPDWQLPGGYDREASDLLLRLMPGYPDVAPDMWWFDPGIRLANGGVAPATELTETYVGRQWQRWSRHFTPGQWQSGIDGLESFFALIKGELERCVKAAPS